MPEKDNKYITNEDLLPEIYKYRRTGKVSEELGGMLLLIAENVANKGNFHGYTWKQDMVSEALLTVIRYIHNFDPIRYEKPNPFAYLTTIISRAFLTYIAKQKKHSHIKDVCYNNCDLLEVDEKDELCLGNQKGIDYTKLKGDGE